MLTGQVFKGTDDRWRWNFVHSNRKIIATSGESFHSRGNTSRALYRFIASITKGTKVKIVD